jgi:hypothetical protein
VRSLGLLQQASAQHLEADDVLTVEQEVIEKFTEEPVVSMSFAIHQRSVRPGSRARHVGLWKKASRCTVLNLLATTTWPPGVCSGR